MEEAFTLPPELWEWIFFAGDGVAGRDKLVLSRSYPVFSQVLKSNLLEQCLAQVIPTLANYLTKNELLGIRQTSNFLKGTIGQVMEMAAGAQADFDRDWGRFTPTVAVSFEDSDLHPDLDLSVPLVHDIQKCGSTFLVGKSLSVLLCGEAEFDKLRAFLQRCGDKVFHLKVTIRIRMLMDVMRTHVWQFLRCTGNLRRFELTVIELSPDFDPVFIRHVAAIFANEPVEPLHLPRLYDIFISLKFSKAKILCECEDGYFLRLFQPQMKQIRKLRFHDEKMTYIDAAAPVFNLTELSIEVFSIHTVKYLMLLEERGVQLKRLTLSWVIGKWRKGPGFYSGRIEETKRAIVNYLGVTRTLKILHVDFEERVNFDLFPISAREEGPSEFHLRSLSLTNVTFDEGLGGLGSGAFKRLQKLHLDYDVLESDFDILGGDTSPNVIYQALPNLNQLTFQEKKKPMIYCYK